jgi:hypothetical protein
MSTGFWEIGAQEEVSALLKEDGDFLLKEDGGRLLTEASGVTHGVSFGMSGTGSAVIAQLGSDLGQKYKKWKPRPPIKLPVVELPRQHVRGYGRFTLTSEQLGVGRVLVERVTGTGAASFGAAMFAGEGSNAAPQEVHGVGATALGIKAAGRGTVNRDLWNLIEAEDEEFLLIEAA